jgi:4-carboxymuconolactone decarboxylase
MSSHRDKGIEMFNEVYCHDLGSLPPPGASKFIDFMVETLFGQLWADETLSIRERRLLLIGAIAALGDATTLRIQMRSALKRGDLTADQLQAATVFMTQYVGYPRASQMFTLLNEVVRELSSQTNRPPE